MGVKTVRVCDATGEELVSPVYIGFKKDGRDIKLEVNQATANRFVLALASRLSSEALAEVVEEFFGKDWDNE